MKSDGFIERAAAHFREDCTMFSSIMNGNAGRATAALALAFAWLLANPLLPAGFGPDAVNVGAAFARHGADDGPNHDVNDDHGGGRHHGGRHSGHK